MALPTSSALPKRAREESPVVAESSKRWTTSAISGSRLCAECQQLDLDASFEIAFYQQMFEPIKSRIDKTANGKHFYDDAVFVHQFGDRLSQDSKCSLCAFFRGFRVKPDEKRHKLLAFRSSDSWLFRADRLKSAMKHTSFFEEYRDTVFMAVVPDFAYLPLSGHEHDWLDQEIPAVGAIYRINESGPRDSKQELLTAREVKADYDPGRVRTWLYSCRNSHGKACRQRATQEPITRGFRVIDCFSDPPKVEEKPWGTTYAALSYVWGSKAADLVDWPKTVLDAVEVTKNMGLQYLWVDRLCINQKDIEEKAYLISKMTTIYEEADFTVVSAAGEGASYGLPGVLNTARTPQPSYYLDSGSTLLSIMRDPRRDILDSTYWTRGWTYQEGVLSNRRIVFTDDQVYWECRCMAVHESLEMMLYHQAANEDDNEVSDCDMVMADFMLTGIFKGGAYSGGSSGNQEDLRIVIDETHRLDHGFLGNEEMTVQAQLRGLNEHMREFSKRQLTRAEDTLPAFQGIVGLYEKTPSIYLLQGLPVWTERLSWTETGAQITFALSVASWYHRETRDHLMFVCEPCPRKPHLPSWTWAGWKGTVTWRAPPNLEHCSYMSDLLKPNPQNPNIVWAANIYLNSPSYDSTIRLLNGDSIARIGNNPPTLLEVRDPYLLNTFDRIEDKDKEWRWTETVGRNGRDQTSAQRPWDARWFRIGRRLSCIGMSVPLSEQQWTDQHKSGQLISVLMFAGRYHDVEHGTARFLTLRRVPGRPGTWERVGTLYLIIPYLGYATYSAAMFKKIPAERRSFTISIQ